MRRALTAALLVLVALAAALGAPRAGSAAPSDLVPPLFPATGGGSRLLIGIADQTPVMFADPRFATLGVRRARLAVPWDTYLRRRAPERAGIDAWLAAARLARVEPLVAFTHSYRRPRQLPSVAQYLRGVRALRRRYRWLRVFSTWNEGNHVSQPTYRAPRRQAQYYLALRRACRGCTLLAAEPLDQFNLKSWTCRFEHWVPARLRDRMRWGLHNYQDANPREGGSRGGTRRFLGLVRGRVWLTETGGIVRFVKRGHVARPYDEGKAARAISSVFRIVRGLSRVDRVYIYHWRAGPRTAGWDSGLLRHDGTPRRSYRILRAVVRSSARRGWRRPRPVSSPGYARACRGMDVSRPDGR